MEEINSLNIEKILDDEELPDIVESKLDEIDELEEQVQLRKLSVETVECVSEIENTREDERNLPNPTDPHIQLENIHVIDCDKYKYIGELLDNKRHGFGVCYYSNGKIYTGKWEHDHKHGYGKMTDPNGDVMQGESQEGRFKGLCQLINNTKKFKITGEYSNGQFSGCVVVQNDYKTYEGEAIAHSYNTIGKLTSTRKPNRIFYGEIHNYWLEAGYGILINKNENMLIGNINSKVFKDYLEMYSHDGACVFGILNSTGQKNGIRFSFSIDGKVTFGYYRDNHRNGPFISFSNCHNLTKSSVRLELFHLDFRSRAVDKMEASKKYLTTYYPEYSSLLSVNYSEMIQKFNQIVTEEMAFYSKNVNTE